MFANSAIVVFGALRVNEKHKVEYIMINLLRMDDKV